MYPSIYQLSAEVKPHFVWRAFRVHWGVCRCSLDHLLAAINLQHLMLFALFRCRLFITDPEMRIINI